MARFIIEFYAGGKDYPSDCDADFYPTREAAETAAPIAAALLDWVVGCGVVEVLEDGEPDEC